MEESDKEFWYGLDKHLPQSEFPEKVRTKRGYVLLSDDKPTGLLRYNLFWDSIPFCTMLFIDSKYQRKGYGRRLMEYWDQDMKNQGYVIVMTSSQSDENAQHFYRKLGYKDCGCLIMDVSGYEQPTEIFFVKPI